MTLCALAQSSWFPPGRPGSTPGSSAACATRSVSRRVRCLGRHGLRPICPRSMPSCASLIDCIATAEFGWDAYGVQSRQATAEVPVYQQQSSLFSNSVKKNISFRSFGTFVDYGIAYVVTASSAISWGIALTLNATDSVWFVLNDRYWDAHYARLNTHDSERIVDFSYIGEGAGP